MTTRSLLPRLALALALAFAPFLPPVSAAAEDKADALFPDPVVASGKGFEIKRSLLQDLLINYKTEMASRKKPIPAGELPEVESNLLHHLILNKILVQRATDEEKSRVNREVAKTVEDYRKAEPSEAVFQAELKASGASLEIITARTVEEQLGKAVLVRELVPSNEMSDDAVKQYYNTFPDKFVIPEQARVAQILISTQDPDTRQPLPEPQRRAKEKLAKEIKAKADQGADFAKLVLQYSDDLAHTNHGGQFPPFVRGLVSRQFEAIEVAAFSLKTNQVSDPVETAYGFHIIKLLEKIPPSQMDFEKIAPKIKEVLIEKTVNTKLAAYDAKLMADYNVKYFPSEQAPSPADLSAPVKK